MKLTRNTISRMISASLAAMLFLTACGNTTDTETENTTAGNDATPDTTTAEVRPDLPERDFGGYKFNFLNGNVVSWFTISSVTAEEENGDTMNDAIYKRNLKVEERYNISITETPSNAAQSDYLKSIQASDNSFDVALLRMEWALPVVLQNAAVNWAEIPHLELDREWWVQGSLTSMSLMNNIYYGVSLFDTTHFDSVRCFYFNKQMIDDFSLESPYDLVKSGKWTLDKFHTMGMAVASDLNGDGEWDENDRYGFGGTPNITGNTLMCGVGAILSIGKDKDDVPFFDLDKESSIERLTAVSKIMGTNDGFVCRDGYEEVFNSGNLLFSNSLIYGAVKMRDSETDFGIIPTPKWNEEQKEYINLGGSPFFMTVPITAEDLDRTGAVMEALAYDSMGLIDKAMYDIVLKGKSSRDEESSDMLDLIFSTLQYYHPLANSYLNTPLADNYIWKGKTDFSSYFASVKDKIQSDIDTAMKTYRENVG